MPHSGPPQDFAAPRSALSLRSQSLTATWRFSDEHSDILDSFGSLSSGPAHDGLDRAVHRSALAAIAQQSSVAAETSSAKVSLAGLDLSTPEGLGIARDRLHDAVRLACSRVAASRDLAHQPNFVKCVEDTQARAMQQVKKPAL